MMVDASMENLQVQCALNLGEKYHSWWCKIFQIFLNFNANF